MKFFYNLAIYILCCLASLLHIQQIDAFELNHKLDDWLKVLKDTDMFVNTGEKKVEFLKLINPSINKKLTSEIGQIGGIDTDKNGDLLVFHRGSREWETDTFIGTRFNNKKYGPIEEDVFILIDGEKSIKKKSWGAKQFYMPHGLTIDFENNIWVSDVGLHQVFKFNPKNLNEPELVLGVKFEPGNAQNQFCKPTDISVSQSTGDIFVSDGYCNNRIVQFDKTGKFKKQFEDGENPLHVAHSITLIERLNLVCTVSRQDGRILCFDIDSGEKKVQLIDDEMHTCYAIEYDPNNQVLHAATGENRQFKPIGLTFDASQDSFGHLLQKWDADERDLNDVHDIAISPDGSSIFLGQLNAEIEQFTYE